MWLLLLPCLANHVWFQLPWRPCGTMASALTAPAIISQQHWLRKSWLKSNLSFSYQGKDQSICKILLQSPFGYVQCRDSQPKLILPEITICIDLIGLFFTLWYNLNAISRSSSWSQLLDWLHDFLPTQGFLICLSAGNQSMSSF